MPVMTLEIGEDDAAELLRLRARRASAELVLREADPELTSDERNWQRQYFRPRDTFHFNCRCENSIVTSERESTCGKCGLAFDLTHWGK